MRTQQRVAERLPVIFMLLAVLGIGIWQVSLRRSTVTANASTAKPKTSARVGNLISVGLLVAPGAKNKTINLGSKDDLAVAILSSAGFDARNINPASLHFAGAPIMKAKTVRSNNRGTSDIKASAPGKQFNVAFEDVNGDKRADLIAHFSIPYLSALSGGRGEAVLIGNTADGSAIRGSEAVQTYGATILRSSSPNGIPGFCNNDPITINDEKGGESKPTVINAAATPYPSTIEVSGLSDVINNITVSVLGFSHTSAQDVSVLLVGPGGQKMILWSQASDGSPAINANLTFDDAASAYLPIDAAIVSGNFKPTNRAGNNLFGDVDFPAPAPTSTPISPYAATLSTFQGSDPNGIWSLYVVDNATGDSGSISGGWCLNINTSSAVTGCKATLFQGVIEAGDATQIGSLLRDGIPSQCVGTAKTCPGATGSATLRYDTYTLTNQNFSPACVTVTTTSSCGTNVFATAYLTSYTPPPPGANLCANYLADSGFSPNATNGIGNAFSFTVPAGATFVLVVNEVAATGCTDYSLLVEGEICAPVGGLCQISCPANITQANDPNQCGAVVNYPAPTTTAVCGTPTCSPTSGSFFPVGTTNVTCTALPNPNNRPNGEGDVATCVFTITVNDTTPPMITCPANITVPNDPKQCGAVASFSLTLTDNCPNPTASCSPVSGSVFPVGTTTVTCTASDNSPDSPDSSCTFTVTVNDTQPPTITCPTNVTAFAPPACPAPSASVTTFTAPTATDNCPGVTVACVPPSGSAFPAGTTTVTCTATDTTGNTATCSFSVKVFNVCVQDRSNPAAVLAWNTSSGDYVFCCNGTTFTGVGKVKRTGCTYTLDHTAVDRRVTGKVDFSTFRGEGAVQSPVGTPRCTISDNDVRNNDCSCIGGAAPPPVK